MKPSTNSIWIHRFLRKVTEPCYVSTRKHAPIVKSAWSQQQPTRDGHRLVIFGFGEASAEVEGQDDEEWNVPGMKKEAAVT